jgi:hypothetical protein
MRTSSTTKTMATLTVVVALGACSDDGGSIWETSATSDDVATAAGDTVSPPDGTTAAADAGDADASADDTAGSGVKLDVNSPTGGVGGCGCDLTYIWVANATESTVSKINTRTLVEEGRYLTREDGMGNPSRTSVNLAGDVAVANRHGGLVKFFAEPSDCVDRNGDGVIQTSTGANDVLPWAVEECRAWFLDFPTTNQRPVAWTGGTTGPDACDGNDANVWTVSSTVPGLFPGLGGNGGVTATLVDGVAGAILEQVDVPDFPGGSFGAYGAAVDAVGNLWFTSLGFPGGTLGRIDGATLDSEVMPVPQGIAPYGITVDHLGRVWLSSNLGSIAGRYDPVAGIWGTVEGFGGGAGLAEGPDGRMWVSAGNRVIGVDLETLVVGPEWTTDESLKGLGFDVDGFLWAVTWKDPKDPASQAIAYKLDTTTLQVEDFYLGLTDPYTYSDMTGYALDTVTCPPAG